MHSIIPAEDGIAKALMPQSRRVIDHVVTALPLHGVRKRKCLFRDARRAFLCIGSRHRGLRAA
jgi:hypothetical protein